MGHVHARTRTAAHADALLMRFESRRINDHADKARCSLAGNDAEKPCERRSEGRFIPEFHAREHLSAHTAGETVLRRE